MKRPTTKPKATADRTLHIEWPWSMTWMEYVDEMLEFLKTHIGQAILYTARSCMSAP